jgi:SAM-dependent methyltransferase
MSSTSTTPHGHRHGHWRGHGILHLPGWFYDAVVRWCLLRGREDEFRRMVLDLAELRSGESLLDLGCGTGTLAMAAGVRVGETGRVVGIDPSARLLARARTKAARRRIPVEFHSAGMQALGLPDQSFDVVTSTFMLHHVPDDLARRGLAEVARVLKPGGRFLLIDFIHGGDEGHGRLDFGSIGIQHARRYIREAGLDPSEMQELTGAFPLRSTSRGHGGYGYVMARRPDGVAGSGAQRFSVP